ncbi:hypothetical protein Q5762_01130 [Streptomyces sp. P9(2023)]|nr:hypothetical protein [Streptomyces sp. P9(2023)]MDT9686972.1 hypothetical protein [Streptomyces sp. P9(2023)]
MAATSWLSSATNHGRRRLDVPGTPVAANNRPFYLPTGPRL